MSKKIWITGGDGQLGHELRLISDQIGACTFTSSSQIDITDIDAVESFWQNGRFDICINTAAYTAVDKAESEPQKAMLVNGIAPKRLADVAQMYSAALIHISTDYVFDGACTGMKRETDRTAPLNQYGMSKLTGENQMLAFCEKATVIRTSWIYGRQGKNFVKTMLRLAQTQPKLRVVADQIGSPTSARTLAQAIAAVVDNPAYGLFHYANQGAVSWFDFAKAIFEMAHLNPKTEPVSSHEFPTPAKRPAYSVLDSQKFADTFGVEIPYWRESLAADIEHIKP